MKKILTLGLIALISITALFTGCSGPFNSLTEMNDQQNLRLSDLEFRMDNVESEIDGIHAWMANTDEALEALFFMVGVNAADIAQLKIDLTTLEAKSDANDAAQQEQINRLRHRLHVAFNLILSKHQEVMNRIDDVVDQQNADRSEYRRGLMMAYSGIGFSHMQIMALWDAFNEAKADFQSQINAVNADLNTFKARVGNAIAEINAKIDDINVELDTKITLAQAEMETYRILFGDIAFDEEGNFKAYYENQMYWGEIFQGYNRVVTGLLYQVAWGISHDDYTPPAHVANAIVSALRDYYTSEVELNIAVEDLQSQIEALSVLITANSGLIETNGDKIEVIFAKLGYIWDNYYTAAQVDALLEAMGEDVLNLFYNVAQLLNVNYSGPQPSNIPDEVWFLYVKIGTTIDAKLDTFMDEEVLRLFYHVAQLLNVGYDGPQPSNIPDEVWYLYVELGENLEAKLADIYDDINAIEAIVTALPADIVNWAGSFTNLAAVTGVSEGDMFYTTGDTTLWLVIDGGTRAMSVAEPGRVRYRNL